MIFNQKFNVHWTVVLNKLSINKTYKHLKKHQSSFYKKAHLIATHLGKVLRIQGYMITFHLK